MKLSKTMQSIVDSVDPTRLNSNTQRVLLKFLSSNNEWVTADSLKIPNATSRIRDLRAAEFGAFDIECSTAGQLGRKGNSRKTYYRMNPKSVAGQSGLDRVRSVFFGA